MCVCVCVCLNLLPHMRMCPVSSSVSFALSSMVKTMLSSTLNFWMSASLWLTAALKYHVPRCCNRHTQSVTWQCGVAVTVWERKLFKIAHVRRPLMERPEGVGSASLWLYLIFISVNLSAVVISVKYQSCTDKMHLTRTLRNMVNSKSRRTEVIIKKTLRPVREVPLVFS